MELKEAQELLAKLTEFFGVPVKPISEYCKGFEDWVKALQQREDDLLMELFPGMRSPDRTLQEEEYVRFQEANKNPGEAYNGSGYFCRTYGETPENKGKDYKFRDYRTARHINDQVSSVGLMIRKSNMLARILYGGEKVRTRKCPVHKGEWSGIDNPWNPSTCGCQMTGWLPEEDVASKVDG